MDKSIIVFCPNPKSLYTVSVCELLQRKGYIIDTIIVRKFTLNRFISEFKRDGFRLIKKIWNKLVLKEKAYKENENNIITFRKNNNLRIKNISEFQKDKTNIVYCNNLNDKSIEVLLTKKQNPLVVFTGGGIIRKNILDNVDGIINCHMGVLPRYKGMDLPEWCILENNLEELGITLHLMDSGIDTGHLLKIIKVPFENESNIKDLRVKFEPIMIQAMVNVVDDYINGKIIPMKQPEAALKQYFIVHKRLYEIINDKIAKLNLKK